MAIQWHKYHPDTSLVDAFHLPKKGKGSMPLQTALDNFCKAPGIEYPTNVKNWASKIQNHMDCKKSIWHVTVKDANNLFQAILKKENEATGYRVRATVLNSIRFAMTGEIPIINKIARNNNGNGTNGNEGFDTAKLKFSAAKLEDLQLLFPIFGKMGRYAGIKTNVQDMINTLPEGQGGLIEAPKKFMDDKEAKAIIQSVNHLWVKSKVKWSMRWNPQRSVFILIRKTDLDKFRNKN